MLIRNGSLLNLSKDDVDQEDTEPKNQEARFLRHRVVGSAGYTKHPGTSFPKGMRPNTLGWVQYPMIFFNLRRWSQRGSVQYGEFEDAFYTHLN